MTSIVHRFRAAARDAGPRIAIRTPARDTTFAELATMVDRFAELLAELPPGRRIAIAATDHAVVVAAMLGVLDAGHAFAPIAAGDRLEPLLAAIRCDAVVVDAGTRARVANLPSSISIVELAGAPVAPSRAPHHAGACDPDAMSSIYFTSGSTGAPRAIAGRLAGIDHHVAWELAYLGLDSSTRGAVIHATSYDAYLPDVLVPLCAGGVACAPASRDVVLDPVALCDWLARERITLLHCVPSLVRALLACPAAARLVDLRDVLLAGEVVRHADVEAARAAWGDRVRLVNLYGPTEATLVKLHHTITVDDLALPSIPIGVPMPGVTVHLLDDAEQASRPGEIGQIAIQSRYGSLGYLDEPALTRERFRDVGAEQRYLTGDYGSRLPDGRLLFHGRRDRLVKLCGARVDLDEVEAILCACDDVDEAVVVAEADSVLRGFVVLSPTGELGRVRAHARERLAPAMRLAWLSPVPELPRTPSGKIDRLRVAELCRETP